MDISLEGTVLLMEVGIFGIRLGNNIVCLLFEGLNVVLHLYVIHPAGNAMPCLPWLGNFSLWWCSAGKHFLVSWAIVSILHVKRIGSSPYDDQWHFIYEVLCHEGVVLHLGKAFVPVDAISEHCKWHDDVQWCHGA